ncbi:hypothetical protein [Labedaea rhizosphaerae]|nr:hypothetical protein [Labedaea rhizosphaerae]
MPSARPGDPERGQILAILALRWLQADQLVRELVGCTYADLDV